MNLSVRLADGFERSVPIDDRVAVDHVVASAYLLGGWKGLEDVDEALLQRLAVAKVGLAALADPDTAGTQASPAATRRAVEQTRAAYLRAKAQLDAWEPALFRFGKRIGAELARAELAGRDRARWVLDESEAEVKAIAERYLSGFDVAIFARKRLTWPTTVRLRPPGEDGRSRLVDPVADLRVAASTLATAEIDATREELYDALVVLGLAGFGPMVMVLSGAAAVQDAVERAVKLAALRSRLGSEHPPLFRMDVTDGLAPVAMDDDALLAALISTLTKTWDALHTVRDRLGDDVWLNEPDEYQMRPGPTRAAGAKLRDAGMGSTFWSLFGSKRFGPWAHHKVMADAAIDLAGPGASFVRQAVHDVYDAVDPALADEFAVAGATMGALVLLHVTFPPAALIADVVLAAKGVAEAISAYLRDSDAYMCTLNPADALAVQPSLLRLAVQCAGEVAGGVPGGKVIDVVGFAAPVAAGLVPEGAP